MKFAVVVFPGSNCDHDAYHAAKDVLGQQADYLWHKDTDLKQSDVVVLPGGFAHGDYLRCGAMARFSPIMRARVFVTLKPSVFDPQGKTIADALHSLGYAGVQDVRQGKYFELELSADSSDQARSMASEVADRLLANPVIESYRIEIA